MAIRTIIQVTNPLLKAPNQLVKNFKSLYLSGIIILSMHVSGTISSLSKLSLLSSITLVFFLCILAFPYLNSDSSLRLLKSTDIKLSKNFLSPSAELSLVFCSNFNTSDRFRKKVMLNWH